MISLKNIMQHVVYHLHDENEIKMCGCYVYDFPQILLKIHAFN